MGVRMVASKVTVETRGALDGPGRALIEGDPTRKRTGRDQAVEVALRCFEALDIGDEFDA